MSAGAPRTPTPRTSGEGAPGDGAGAGRGKPHPSSPKESPVPIPPRLGCRGAGIAPKLPWRAGVHGSRSALARDRRQSASRSLRVSPSLQELVQTTGKPAAPAAPSTGLGLGTPCSSCIHPIHEIPTMRHFGTDRGREGEGRRLQRAPFRPFGWLMLLRSLGAR